jgi:hypothetical protein
VQHRRKLLRWLLLRALAMVAFFRSVYFVTRQDGDRRTDITYKVTWPSKACSWGHLLVTQGRKQCRFLQRDLLDSAWGKKL